MKARVLVIDDEEDIRYTFGRFLEAEGYEPVAARGYDEAVAALTREDFDLIVADILLGGRTGLELLGEVHERGLCAPVVMVTGAPSIETAAEAVRLGAYDYLPKPVHKEMLLRVVRKAVEHKVVLDESRKNRANLEAVFRSVRDGIVTVQRERRVLELNEAACRLFGLRREEVLGRELDALPFQGCKGKVLEALARCLERQETVQLHRMECLLRGKQRGRVVDVTISPLLDGGGALSGAVVVMRDETRLALLERDTGQRKEFEGMGA